MPNLRGVPAPMLPTVLGALLIGVLCAPLRVAAQDASALKRLALEDLMDVDVTSVSRRAEPISDAAAAIDVITSDQIRRSGATTLAEVLRLATGLAVARVDTTTWAISARGFNSTAANKLLVLIDGRSVYTPLFSGVFWDVQDTLLADVDRIEVIRGPGGILWGANAVNGVINIITKTASRTQGGRVELASGNKERGLATIRYGDELGSSAQYRAYGKFNYQDPQRTASGESGEIPSAGAGRRPHRLEAVRRHRGGNHRRCERRQHGASESAAHRRRRWQHHRARAACDLTRSGAAGAGVLDRTFRSMPGLLEEQRGTWDLDVQYRARVSSRHMLLAGGTYRLTRDRTACLRR